MPRLASQFLALTCSCLIVAPALAQSSNSAPNVAPSPAPSPAASAKAEEMPEAYRRILTTLKSRKEEDLPPTDLRFGRSDADWGGLRVKEIKATPRGLALVLDDDPKEYYPNDKVKGKRLVALTAEEATFEHAGEQRRVKLHRATPLLQVRAIKQVEGEWAAFMEGERRPLYPGDVVRGARIVRIEPDGVSFQMGVEIKKFGPKAVKPPFPTLAFNGIINMPGMPGGRVVLIKGRPDPVKVGDLVEGAKILEITPASISVEYEGQKRNFAPK